MKAIEIISLSETNYSTNFFWLKQYFISKIHENFNYSLDRLIRDLKYRPEIVRSYKWQKTADDMFSPNSMLHYFSNAITTSIGELGFTKSLQKFNISGYAQVQISPSSTVPRDSYALDDNKGRPKILYSFENLIDFQNDAKTFLFPRIKRITAKTNLEKWKQSVKVTINQLAEYLASKENINKFCSALIHEFTHLSQSSKVNTTNFDAFTQKNVFGNRLDTYYFTKIAKGIFDKDYYGSFNEIDAYANEVATNIIQKSNGKINIPQITNLISHPAYNIFKQIAKENDPESALYEKAWRRFVKRVVTNLQHHNASIDGEE